MASLCILNRCFDNKSEGKNFTECSFIVMDKNEIEISHDNGTGNMSETYGTIFTAASEKPSYIKATCQTIYVTFAAIVASVGGILFGYDIGITGGALLQLKQEFSLTSFEQEMVVSGVLFGAFCASFVGGNIVDAFGRKLGISFSCLLFIIGAVILSVSVNIVMLIIGRFIVGVAVSLSVTSECTYISEISPPSRRGMMVSLNEVGITVGFLLAYLINYLFISVHNGWKFMFGAAAFLAFIQGFGVIFMPNSHVYLLIKGKQDKAKKVLKRLRNTEHVDEELENIMSAMEEQKNYRYADLFSTTNNMRGRLILGMALVFLQQFSGNSNVLFYAPTVFQHFGYHSDSVATLVTVGLGVVKVIATLVTLCIVDRVGRRTLLLTGSIIMASSILVLGIVGTFQVIEAKKTYFVHQHPIVFHNHTIIYKYGNISNMETTSEKTNALKMDDDFTDKFNQSDGILRQITEAMEADYEFVSSENDTDYLNGTLDDKSNFNKLYEDVSTASKIISVISLMVFVCAYGISYGPVTWLVLSEIFPGALRGRAVSVATCINWGSNIIVSLTFLDVLNYLGIGPTFIVYGFISTGAAIFIYLCVPETKGKTLEEIDVLMSKGFIQKDLKLCGKSPPKMLVKENGKKRNSSVVMPMEDDDLNKAANSNTNL